MKKCIICGSKKLNLLKKINTIKILECKKCFLGITETSNKQNNNLLYNSSGLYNLKNYKDLKKNQKIKFNKIVNLIKKYISKKSLILEVGAGFGLFANMLIKNNYKVEIIEPNLPLYFLKDISNDLKIYKLIYQKFLKNNKTKYDCIIFLDTLEHFVNPNKIMEETIKILKKNSYIVINLPNYQSMMAKLSKNWAWWMIEDHKYHFSPSSIKNFLQKNELRIIHFETYEQFWDFKKNLDGNFTDIKIPILRKILKGIFFIIFFSIYIPLKKLIWFFGYGGLMLIIAKKIND